MPRHLPRSVCHALFFATASMLAACGGDGDSAQPEASGEPARTAGTPASSPAVVSGRWTGEATGGYKGNRISFTVGPDGARMEDITFQGHWDCEDGIESATLGPTRAFPLAGDSISILSVEPEGGGASAQRFHMQGRFAGGRASGTLRINVNALGCDTRVLSWTAAPAS